MRRKSFIFVVLLQEKDSIREQGAESGSTLRACDPT